VPEAIAGRAGWHAELRARIAADPVLRAVLAEVERRMEADAAHDLGHLLRVAHWTLRLTDGEPHPDGDPRLAVAAALLHDVVNVPKTHPDRARASERSAEVAHELLAALGVPEADAAVVADAVRDHSYTRGAVPSSPLGRALQDADRLEALGVVGTFRCVATGVRFGAEFSHPDDPWARARPLDDKRYSVDHFFTKLLRLPATFHTAAGRAEAERRAAVMRRLLAEYGEEVGEPPPTD
jgi:uncharacterized protein